MRPLALLMICLRMSVAIPDCTQFIMAATGRGRECGGNKNTRTGTNRCCKRLGDAIHPYVTCEQQAVGFNNWVQHYCALDERCVGGPKPCIKLKRPIMKVCPQMNRVKKIDRQQVEWQNL